MKRSCLSLITCLCFFMNEKLQAQNVSVNDLRTPASPGFILMDEAPASVEKPTTPQGFALNVLSLRQGGALEVAPYWLVPHPNLGFNQYARGEFPILQTLSVSIATTTKNDTTNVALGGRVQILRLRSRSNNSSITTAEGLIQAELNAVAPNVNNIVAHKGTLLQALDRPTLVVEAAYSFLGKTGMGNWSSLTRSRYGGWVNVKLRPEENLPLEAVFLARYLVNPDFQELPGDSKVWDYGGRALYTFNRVECSIEYVARHVVGAASYDRLAGIVEYKLSNNLYATATLGKNFSQVNNIIALFGVNISLSSAASF